MTDQTTTYVALVQQGMVLDQRAIAGGTDKQELQRAAETEAAKLNSQATMTEGYTAVVLEVPPTVTTWREALDPQPAQPGWPPVAVYTYQQQPDGTLQCYFYGAPDLATAQAKGEQLARIAQQAGQQPLGFMVGALQNLPE